MSKHLHVAYYSQVNVSEVRYDIMVIQLSLINPIKYNCLSLYCIFIMANNIMLYRLPNGAEYLFVARDDADVSSWVQAINSVIQGGSAASSTGSLSSALSSPPQSQLGSAGHTGQ